MNKLLNNILFIFPIMGYYVLEAIIVSIFITLVGKLFLNQIFGNIGYFQIVAIYWIIKMLLFNVFNLITGLFTMPSNIQQKIDKQNNRIEK